MLTSARLALFISSIFISVSLAPASTIAKSFDVGAIETLQSSESQGELTLPRSNSNHGESISLLAQLGNSKERAQRGDFDEVGNVSCAQERGESLKTCKAAVSRSRGGATLVVTFPSGFARLLHFENGKFVRASTTMSGSGRDIEWSLEDALFRLRADDQRFEVPARFVLGDRD